MFQDTTANDPTLQLVAKYLKDGWPEKRKLEPCVKPFYTVCNDITYVQGLVLKGARWIIVPSSLRKEVRKLIHTGYFDIDKCISWAKECVYWPGMTSELEDMVSHCSTCIDHCSLQRPEPLMKHDILLQPWTKVGTDVFHLYGRPYVIVIDYTTKFFDLNVMPNVESDTVITNLKSIFAKYGIPQTVVSDNGPEYSSKEFATFATQWDFQHDPSSPRYPQSNGMVERTIQTVKRTIKKAIESKQDPYLALLALRTTPLTSKQTASPATLLMGRTLRTTMPNIKFTRPTIQPECNDRKQVMRELPELQPGDSVRVLYGKVIKGRVIRKSKYPQSYLVLTENGTKVRRNRRHLLRAKETINATWNWLWKHCATTQCTQCS